VETPIAFHNMPMAEFTKENLMRRIQAIRYMNGACTATGDALQQVRQICDKNCRGRHEGVSRVALVLTDGYSNCGTAVGIESTNLLHITKASVFAVGIGTGVNNAELLTIATDKKYVIHVNNYLELTTAINSITIQTCGIPAFVVPNVKVESEVPSNTYRYYQLDTTELLRQDRNSQGGYIEIISHVLLGEVEVYTSTTNANPGTSSGQRVQFQTRGTEQYYIEYIEQNTPRLYFSFYGVQATNEYDFVVRWLDIGGTLIG
jgi:methyl coenzyme M reductase subunit C